MKGGGRLSDGRHTRPPTDPSSALSRLERSAPAAPDTDRPRPCPRWPSPLAGLIPPGVFATLEFGALRTSAAVHLHRRVGVHPRVVGLPTINSLERAKPHVQSRHLPHLRQGQLHRMRSTRRAGAGRCSTATAMQLRTRRPLRQRRIGAVAAVRAMTPPRSQSARPT